MFLFLAVDSGRALTALSLFVDEEEDVTTPQRSLLQTPRYGKSSFTAISHLLLLHYFFSETMV